MLFTLFLWFAVGFLWGIVLSTHRILKLHRAKNALQKNLLLAQEHLDVAYMLLEAKLTKVSDEKTSSGRMIMATGIVKPAPKPRTLTMTKNASGMTIAKDGSDKVETKDDSNDEDIKGV